jgi:phosphohistidine phosphatase
MDLILWRHAEAEDGVPDFERALTARGRKQASRMADWLNPRLPPDIRILVSPATRTMQTAQALGRHYETLAALAPGATADGVLAGAGWPDASHPALVVGHQPTLGQTAMRLLAGKDLDAALKKGAIWWFQGRARNGRVETVLRAVVAPDWL